MIGSNANCIYVFCDGGLANRVGSYISGKAVAEHLGLDVQLVWPKNNRCGVAFEDIFVANEIVLPARLLDFVPYAHLMRLWMHEPLPDNRPPTTDLRALTAIADLDALPGKAAGPVLFTENTVFRWLLDDTASRILNELTFVPAIVAAARDILARHVKAPYYGIHLRGTDFLPPPPVEAMLDLVAKNPAAPFFICSDDASIEARFMAHPNVFTQPKSAYVEKLADGPWKTGVRDSDGLLYTSNIDRTAESVIAACVDLLLLGASTPIKTSASTFLGLAERMRQSGFIQRHLAG